MADFTLPHRKRTCQSSSQAALRIRGRTCTTRWRRRRSTLSSRNHSPASVPLLTVLDFLQPRSTADVR
jgi:hypothetical protein